MSLKEKIKNARKENKLTQKQLANELTKYGKKFKNSSISNWENGLSEPDIDTLKLLCKILNKNANYFLSIEENIENKLNTDGLDKTDIKNINEYIQMYKLAKEAKNK